MTTTRRALSALVCHGHSRPIVEVSYSPSTPDGVFLISASKDGKPMLRSGDTGDWIGTFEGHNGAVWGAALNSPALLAVTGSADFSAKVWDACSGDMMHSFEHKHIVRSVAFAGHSHHNFATGCQDKCVRLFDVNCPDADPTVMNALPASVRCLKWIQEDNILLAACLDKSGIHVLDTRTGQRVIELETADPVMSIDIADDNSLVTAEAGCAQVWDQKSLAPKRKYAAGDYHINSAALSTETGTMVLGGSDMWVHVLDAGSGEEVDVCKGHHGPVHVVRFRPGGQSFASGSEDGTIRIWQPAQEGADA